MKTLNRKKVEQNKNTLFVPAFSLFVPISLQSQHLIRIGGGFKVEIHYLTTVVDSIFLDECSLADLPIALNVEQNAITIFLVEMERDERHKQLQIEIANQCKSDTRKEDRHCQTKPI